MDIGTMWIRDIPIGELHQYCKLNAKYIVIKRGKLIGIYPE